jgi:hypothetical protein
LTRSRCVGTVCDRIINTDLSFVNIHTIQCIASTRGICLILKVYKAKASRSVGSVIIDNGNFFNSTKFMEDILQVCLSSSQA